MPTPKKQFVPFRGHQYVISISTGSCPDDTTFFSTSDLVVVGNCRPFESRCRRFRWSYSKHHPDTDDQEKKQSANNRKISGLPASANNTTAVYLTMERATETTLCTEKNEKGRNKLCTQHTYVILEGIVECPPKNGRDSVWSLSLR